MDTYKFSDHIAIALVQALHTKGLLNAQEVAQALDQSAMTRQFQMNRPPAEDAELRSAAAVLQQFADTLNQTHPWPAR